MSLYRFGERKFLEEYLTLGKLSFGPATYYKDADTAAQRDDEQSRKFRPDLKHHKLAIGGELVKGLTDFQVEYTAKDTHGNKLQYYLISFTSTYDKRMFDEFKNADACLEIFNQEEFEYRLGSALDAMNWKGHLGFVEYFDPKKLAAITDSLRILFCKDHSQAYQKEFRVAILPMKYEDLMDGRKEVFIKPMSDIARFI